MCRYQSPILLYSAAAQVHPQLEKCRWCKAHHQNRNCHGNCPSWQQILQTHILWNTERFTWWLIRAMCELFGGSPNERDTNLYEKGMLGCLDEIVQSVIKHWTLKQTLKLFKSLFLLSGIGVISKNSWQNCHVYIVSHFKTNVRPWEKWQPSKRSHQAGLRNLPTH